jgi:preprotein translocase subunit YajC
MSHLVLSTSAGLNALLLAKTAAKTTTGSSTTLIFLALILVAGYFLLIRPQRQRARRQQQTQQEIGVGDEVMLTSGIIGRVMGFEGDRATIEIADGIDIEVLRRAIAQRIAPTDATYEESEEVGPDPAASDDEDDYDHPSDEVHPNGYGIPHGLSDDDREADEGAGTGTGGASGTSAADSGAPSGSVTAEGTSTTAAEDVPRVPGGGLGGPTQPDGHAGTE